MLVLSAVCSAVAFAQETPKAVVAAPVVDKGVVPRGELIRHAFEIRNEGTVPLAIAEVRPGCGCTVARFDESVTPGGKGLVEIELDTEAFTGPIAKSVAVYTNDPSGARIQLTVKADVQPFVAVSPGYARHFLVLGAPPAEPVRQLVWATDGRNLSIDKVVSPAPQILAVARRATDLERAADGPEVQWVVETRLAPDAPIGPIAGRVELHTNHPKEKVATVAVSGNVAPGLSVSPPSASLGVVGSEEPARVSVVLTNNTATDLKISIESVSIAGLEADLRTIDERRTQLALTLPAGRPSGRVEGMVVLTTNMPGQERIEIPVEGTIR
jgi:hypothetical protein